MQSEATPRPVHKRTSFHMQLYGLHSCLGCRTDAACVQELLPSVTWARLGRLAVTSYRKFQTFGAEDAEGSEEAEGSQEEGSGSDEA